MEIAPEFIDVKVSDLMTELTAVPPSTPISKVASILRSRNAYEAFIEMGDRMAIISIRDILRAKHIHSMRSSSIAVQVPTLAPDSGVVEAARLMTEHRTRALPIVRGGKAIGEITALSICRWLSSTGKLGFVIDKIMTGHPITLKVNDPLAKAKRVMIDSDIDHLPVLGDGRVRGLLTSQLLLDALIPPEKPRKDGMIPEPMRVDRILVSGLMDPTPLICSVGEGASAVLNKMVGQGKTCALIGLGEELQGIATYRDFVKLLARPARAEVPIYMVGLPEDPFEAEAAKAKFAKAVGLLRKSFPEILEARAKIKASSSVGGGRRRYEVKTFVYTPKRIFVHSEVGWDLASIFDAISSRLKKIMSGRAERRGAGLPRGPQHPIQP